MKRQSYLLSLCLIAVASTFVSCSNTSNNSTSPQDRAMGLVGMMNGDAPDQQNAMNFLGGPILWSGFGGGFGGSMGFLDGFGFPFLGQIWGFENLSCVSVQNNGSGNQDVIYTFNCTKKRSITGTIEFKGSTDSSGKTYEVITKVTTSDSSGDSHTKNSDQTVTRNSDGSFSIAKTFDDTSTSVSTNTSSSPTPASASPSPSPSPSSTSTSNTFELKGSVSEAFTPDTAGSPSQGGDITINNSVDFIENGTDQGTYTVTSSGLHRSQCGFDKGSITFTNSTDTIVVTYSGCGNQAITDNGKTITPFGFWTGLWGF